MVRGTTGRHGGADVHTPQDHATPILQPLRVTVFFTYAQQPTEGHAWIPGVICFCTPAPEYGGNNHVACRDV